MRNKVLYHLPVNRLRSVFGSFYYINKWIWLMIPILMVAQSKTQTGPPRRMQDLGIRIGILPAGSNNAITDLPGVKVGQVTLILKDSIRTGVTAILPHPGNIFQEKVPAAIWVGNGFGKLTGFTQVSELGQIETPIILTNTLSVPAAADAVLDYILHFPGNEHVVSVNPVVGETNDGRLNDIRGMHVKKKHVLEAINIASDGPVEEGTVGAGTGTICFGFKGGIGTASRVIPQEKGGYTVGVLVQTNFGGILQIAGVPVGQELGKYYLKEEAEQAVDGSCMIVVATDAPLDARNLKRLAQRAMLGLGRTGGISSNGSGEYVIAFSTSRALRIPHRPEGRMVGGPILSNQEMTPLFLAIIEATEEAILNSLFMATPISGKDGIKVDALPVEKVLQIMEKYHRLKR